MRQEKLTTRVESVVVSERAFSVVRNSRKLKMIEEVKLLFFRVYQFTYAKLIIMTKLGLKAEVMPAGN